MAIGSRAGITAGSCRVTLSAALGDRTVGYPGQQETQKRGVVDKEFRGDPTQNGTGPYPTLAR